MITDARPMTLSKSVPTDTWFNANVGNTGRTHKVQIHVVKVRIGNQYFTGNREYNSFDLAEKAAKRMMKTYG